MLGGFASHLRILTVLPSIARARLRKLTDEVEGGRRPATRACPGRGAEVLRPVSNSAAAAEKEEDEVTEDLDYGEEFPVEDDSLPTSATASANGDEEEFVTFVDETFPADNFENYELRY